MTTQDSHRRRLPRFARVAGGGMRLTARDLEILRSVHRYRFLRSSHIAPLVGGSPQQVLRRLRLLFDHGLLDRPRAQTTFRMEPRNEPLIYGLGARGASALAELDPSLQGRSDWTSKNKKAGVIFLEHTLMISDVMVAFELACRQSDGIELFDEPATIALMPEHARTAKQPLHWKGQVAIASRRPTSVGLLPDRVFTLALENRSRRSNFMLEADRGTMRVTPQNPKNALERNSFNRKLLAYHAGWKDGFHTRQFGWRNFRVLTVTTSAERVETMVAAASETTGGAGAGMFLFTDLQSFLADNPLTHIWTDGKGRRVTLIAKPAE